MRLQRLPVDDQGDDGYRQGQDTDDDTDDLARAELGFAAAVTAGI